MDTLESVQAVVLAGGLGTRLRPVVADRPKVLADACGRSFLSYILDQLVEAGIRSILMCTGYLGEQIQQVFGAAYGGAVLSYSQEPTPLGTAGALKHALPILESDPVLVLNGDSMCRADLAAFLGWHRRMTSRGTLLLTEVQDVSRYGSVRVDSSGRILRFDEKGGGSGPGLISVGRYLLSRELIATIPSDRAVSIERESFPEWISMGLYGYACEAPFLDIGTPDSLSRVGAFLNESGAGVSSVL